MRKNKYFKKIGLKTGNIASLALVCLLVISCGSEAAEGPLFKLLDNKSIGIEFSNDLKYDKDFNVYKYRNFYNGGGVAIGDVNNDGLMDIYLVSNQGQNKLYLNKGDLKFEDITATSRVGGNKAWSTGVTFVDVNQDELMDIYVCNSGDVNGDNKENELFINNGDMTFTESAMKYNLNDKGYSTHASFFDYDKDGDLDAYLLNNSYQAIGSFNLRKNERMNHDTLGGDKLMRNDGGVFKNVSAEANIYNSVIGFGLGVTVSDFNNDTWQDIFVSNDFFERDYLYINQKDGTFKEDLPNQINSTSAASMGADAADIDNDGNPDLFVTDMLPSEYERLKTVTTFDDWDRYNYNLKNGYHHQFTRNVLQRNNGNGTFSEISRYAGVEASDWSWGALFFDMNNDGNKDLFIANGILKDLTNQDYLQYIANEKVAESMIQQDGVNYKELIDIIPSNKVRNQGYLNKGNLKFEAEESTGLWEPSFSNGAAYGDLDNDGDLDLVVNNISMQCFIYENTLNPKKANYLKFDLKSNGSSSKALGAKVIVTAGQHLYAYENMPTRGFQSSMDPRINVGVGTATRVDVTIKWPSGGTSNMKNVAVNQTLVLDESEGVTNVLDEGTPHLVFGNAKSKIDYTKTENRYSDFNRERLIYHMRSNEGAHVGQGDLNGDRIDDLVFPGAMGSVTEIHFGNSDGSFTKQKSDEILEQIKGAEHTNCILLDVDGDKDLDLYLTSGGVEISEYSQFLNDNLLINDGKGHFTASATPLPTSIDKKSIKAVAYSDIDEDGDLDIVVGERIKIGKFGMPASGFVMFNDGNGKYADRTKDICPDLENIGMITDIEFADIDQDGDEDLFVVGEFMDIHLFTNENGKLVSKILKSDIPLKGCWNDINLTDIDNDGDLDIIASNFGENNRFEASEERPMKLFVADYDNNSFPEGIMTFQAENGKDYPYALRHNLIDQMKGLKKKYPDFESFKNEDMVAIFTEEGIDRSKIWEVNQLKSVILLNDGNYTFSSVDLPVELQFSCMYTSEVYDFDQDGDMDILFGGNQFSVVPEMGIYDGSFGIYLENQGDNKFVTYKDGAGFMVRGEIRDFIVDKNQLMVVRSRDTIQTFIF
ncbi:MAG: hypothetical protein ACI9P5_002923 [Saprospiraceae bacterium]|jgi:hypothetical protein